MLKYAKAFYNLRYHQILTQAFVFIDWSLESPTGVFRKRLVDSYRKDELENDTYFLV